MSPNEMVALMLGQQLLTIVDLKNQINELQKTIAELSKSEKKKD